MPAGPSGPSIKALRLFPFASAPQDVLTLEEHMQLMTVKAKRRFTDGALKGIVIDEQWCCFEPLAPKVGDERTIDRPAGGSPYIDLIVAVYPSPQ